jgi:hypothetical protein
VPSDLKARLRQVDPSDPMLGAASRTRYYRNPDGPEAALRIEELESDIQLMAAPHESVGSIILAYRARIEGLEVEMQRLHQWVLAESGGASLTPNTVDAAILIGTERGREMESAQKERDFWEAANTRTLEMLPAFVRTIERSRDALRVAEVALAIAQGYRPITRAPDGDRIVKALGAVRDALDEVVPRVS